ncbi:40S ribosomal protein S2 [Dictyocoela muelleri]|nr:40S ribosomal protein S2 [Dictyocoela muelleri]
MSDTQRNNFIPRRRKEWHPRTNLGRLVKARKICAEEIFEHSLPITEPEIIDFLFGSDLHEEILCIKSIQKQTKAGQRTRMKVVVAVGNKDGYIGIGSKSGRDVATAMQGAKLKAKCAIRPVKIGFWGNIVGEPHTVPVRVKGKSGSVSIELIPAPKGAGLQAGKIPKKILQLAGINDIFTYSMGNTSTTENFAKATFSALMNATQFYTPDLWERGEPSLNPLIKHADFLRRSYFNQEN